MGQVRDEILADADMSAQNLNLRGIARHQAFAFGIAM